MSTQPTLSPGRARRNVCLVMAVAILTTLALTTAIVSVFLVVVAGVGQDEPGTGQRVVLPTPSPAPTPAAVPILSTATISRLTEISQFSEGDVGAAVYAPDGYLLATAVGRDILFYDTLVEQFVLRLNGHKNDVQAMAFSPVLEEGEPAILASCAVNETSLLIWDVQAGQAVWRLEGHTGWIRSLAFSPDGALLASASTDTTIRLWEFPGGTLRHTLRGHSDMVSGVAFHPDGTLLASTSRDGTVRFWDTTSGEQVRQWSKAQLFARVPPTTRPDNPSWTTGIAFSPDGSRLAVGTTAAVVQLFDVETGRLIHTLQGHTDWIGMQGVDFSPDGRTLASASLDGTIRLWDLESGMLRDTLNHGRNQLLGVSWNPRGETLATSSTMSGRVTIWDPEQGVVVQDIPLVQGAPVALSYASDGQTLAAAGQNGTIRLHLLDQHRQVILGGGASTPQAVAFLGKDRLIVATSDTAGRAALFDLTLRQRVQTISHLDGEAVRVAVSPDRTAREEQAGQGGQAGQGEPTIVAVGSNTGEIVLWDVQQEKPLRTLHVREITQEGGAGAARPGSITALTFCNDGAYLAASTGGDESTDSANGDSDAGEPQIGVWDIETGVLHTVLQGHSDTITALAARSGTSQLASTGRDGSLRLWDCVTGQEIAHLHPEAPVDWFTSAAFSPDGSLLAAGDTGGLLMFWDAETAELLHQVDVGGGGVLSLAFRPDGKQLAAGTRTEGMLLLEYRPPPDP